MRRAARGVVMAVKSFLTARGVVTWVLTVVEEVVATEMIVAVLVAGGGVATVAVEVMRHCNSTQSLRKTSL